MRLLVVDFDFFFPVVEDPQDPRFFLYDWAHFETPYTSSRPGRRGPWPFSLGVWSPLCPGGTRASGKG